MFIEFVTQKGEKVLLNVRCILSVIEHKRGCLIIDTDGMDYPVAEEFDSFCKRLNSKTCQKL